MNNQIKEMAEQAGLGTKSNESWSLLPIDQHSLERFAELVRQDEREQLRNRTTREQQLMDGQASLLRGRTE